MSAPQGTWSFPGIDNIIQGQFTLNHGTQPSQGVIVAPYSPRLPLEVGTLSLRYGSTVLSWPDSKIDFITLSAEGDGKQLLQIHILDRRWKWEFGQISGYYNTRVGGEIDASTQKNARELATLCFQAMGDKRFDVRKIPTDIFPEIEWDVTNPAKALANVCEQVGCRVVLKLNNSVVCEKVGQGANLPLGGDYVDATLTADPAERPDDIVFEGDTVLYEVILELEAIAEDTDAKGNPLGIDKPIDELQYAWQNPATGKADWRYFDLGMANSIEPAKVRELVKRDLYRRYRIKTPFKFQYPIFSLDKKGKKKATSFNIDDLKRILPVEDRLVETAEVLVGNKKVKQRKPYIVYGLWYNGADGLQSNYHQGKTKKHGGVDLFFEELPKHDLTKNPQAIYRGHSTLIADTGVVEFTDPMVRYFPVDAKEPAPAIEVTDDGKVVPAFVVFPAKLFLRTAVGLRDKDTRAWLRAPVKRDMPGRPNNTQPLYVTASDVRREFRIDYAKGNTIIDNVKEYEKAGNHYLDIKQQELQISTPASVHYAGFKRIDPDGAIWQVGWETNGEGFAFTRASRNREELIGSSFEVSRRNEKLTMLLAERDKTTRAASDKLKRGA